MARCVKCGMPAEAGDKCPATNYIGKCKPKRKLRPVWRRREHDPDGLPVRMFVPDPKEED